MAAEYAGCLSAAWNGTLVKDVCLQVLDVKQISTDPQPRRYRFFLSDTQNQAPVMAASQLTSLIESTQVKKGTILSVSELMVNKVGERRVLIALGGEVMGYEAQTIGNPVLLVPPAKQSGAAQQPEPSAATPAGNDYNAVASPLPSQHGASHNSGTEQFSAGHFANTSGSGSTAQQYQQPHGGGAYHPAGASAAAGPLPSGFVRPDAYLTHEQSGNPHSGSTTSYGAPAPPGYNGSGSGAGGGGGYGSGAGAYSSGEAGYGSGGAAYGGAGPAGGSGSGGSGGSGSGVGGSGGAASGTAYGNMAPSSGVGSAGGTAAYGSTPPFAFAGGASGGHGGGTPQGGGGGASNNGEAYGSGGGYGGGGTPQQYSGGGGASNPSSWTPQAARYGSGGGAVARNDAPLRIQPIASLNPYTSKWTIKARCTSKSDIRRWNGTRGEGKVFNFDLLDKEGGEIRVTGFNDQADKYHGLVEVGHIYLVSKANLAHKKPQFNTTNHDFEIRLERDSIVEEVHGDADAANIPTVLYNFRTLNDIASLNTNTTVDVMAVVESVENWQTIAKKNGEETQKRSIILRDDTNRSIELTLWGAMATSGVGEALEQRVRQGDHPIVAVKGARIGDFNGKTLSTLNSSIINMEPDHPHTAVLRSWYSSQAGHTAAEPLSMRGAGGGGRVDRRCTIAAIRDEQLGKSGKPDWVAVSGSIAFIRRGDGAPLSYPGCPKDFSGRLCSKKMVEQSAGQWFCERCNAYSEPQWRYMVQLQAADHTGSQWVTAFGDAGESIFKMPANQLRALEAQDPDRLEEVFKAAIHTQRIFKLKVAEELWQDEMKLKVSIARVEDVDYVKESQVLLDYIHKLETGQPIMVATPALGNGVMGSGGGTPGGAMGAYSGGGRAAYASPGAGFGGTAAYAPTPSPQMGGGLQPQTQQQRAGYAAGSYSTSPSVGSQNPGGSAQAVPQQQYGTLPLQQPYSGGQPSYGKQQQQQPPQQQYGVLQGQFGQPQQPGGYSAQAGVNTGRPFY